MGAACRSTSRGICDHKVLGYRWKTDADVKRIEPARKNSNSSEAKLILRVDFPLPSSQRDCKHFAINGA